MACCGQGGGTTTYKVIFPDGSVRTVLTAYEARVLVEGTPGSTTQVITS